MDENEKLTKEDLKELTFEELAELKIRLEKMTQELEDITDNNEN